MEREAGLKCAELVRPCVSSNYLTLADGSDRLAGRISKIWKGSRAPASGAQAMEESLCELVGG